VIAAYGLTKDYGKKRAVDDLRFSVRPGILTEFLGPNGSGKSTTIRLILGLDAPTAGSMVSSPVTEPSARPAMGSEPINGVRSPSSHACLVPAYVDHPQVSCKGLVA
jgi:ABC-type multidrug transport system ATPase subunit